MWTTKKLRKRLASQMKIVYSPLIEKYFTEDGRYFISPTISNTICICESLSELAAKKVIEIHRMCPCESVNFNEIELSKFKNKKHKIPGRPQLLKSTSKAFDFRDGNNEIKLERFQKFLCGSYTANELCDLSWPGIPARIRPSVWRLLSKYAPIQNEKRYYILNKKRNDYFKMIQLYYNVDKSESDLVTHHQIHIDVPRMNANIPLFQQKIIQEMFERILYIWAVRHPAVGYVQGINDLVTPFFIVFLEELSLPSEFFELHAVNNLTRDQWNKIEADTFWCATNFLEKIQENYIIGQPGIHIKVNQLKTLIQRIDSTLHNHLIKNNIDYLQFSFRWLNNLLTRELPLRCIIRLWDTYLSENETFDSFQVYVCAAFLLYWKKQLLLQNDFQELMLFLQNLPTQHWTNAHVALLVAEAYRLKVMFADSPNHLKYK